MNNEEYVRRTLRGAAPGLIDLLGIIMIIVVFHPSFTILLVIIMTYHIGKEAYAAAKKKSLTLAEARAAMKRLTALFLTIIALYLLNRFLGGYGFLGVLVFVILYVAWLLWRKRKAYVESVRHIETMIYGCPAEDLKKRGRR